MRICSSHCLALGLSLIGTACFDTEQVAIASRVSVDDFEDGDQLAKATSGFGPWWCGAYPREQQEEAASFDLSPGFGSTFAESMTFSLLEPTSAEPSGAILGVDSLAPTRDLSSFERITFRAKFDAGEPAPPPEARLLPELSCALAKAARDDLDADVSVLYHGETHDGVELPGDWTRYSLSLADFRQPSWQGQLFDEASCFTLVDSIRFRIDVNLLTVGQAVAGTLTIDDVELE